MTNKEKITVKLNWSVAGHQRVNILGATYRQALSYLNTMRLQKITDVLSKPVLK